MHQQILTASGKSIWKRRDCDFAGEIRPGDRTVVSWHGSEWFAKFKEQSTNEIIGYQLAGSLGLPLQPWLAVEMDVSEPTGVDKPDLAILIQRWASKRRTAPLEYPISTHPTSVGKALALASMIPNDVEWLSDEEIRELRLVDLEFCGPAITFIAAHRWTDLVSGYLDGVHWNARRCYELASEVRSTFLQTAHMIARAKLSVIIDVSGHSRADDIVSAAMSFLEPARKLLSAISR